MTVWEEKLVTHKTTRKSMAKTNTSGGSQSTTGISRTKIFIAEVCT